MAEVLATYVLGTDTISTIEAGVQNENDASCVKFDYSDWKEEYGDGILSMRIQRREDDDPYPVLLTVSTDPDDGENVMVWSISDVDTAQIGKHKAQLTYTVDGVRKKTTVFLYRIVRSVVSGDTVPDPYDDWLEDLESMASDMLDDGAAIVNEAKGYRNEASGYATAASGSATSASGSASDSEAYAKGTRGGTAVASDDPAYHKNSKYYSEQAATSATNASGSASDANTAKGQAEYFAGQAYQSSEDARGYASNASASAVDSSGFSTASAGHSQNSEAWAKGTRGGTAVGSDDPAYHNNSKYFSEQASASATAAAGSATAAAASVSSLAPAYSSSATYDVGDYVLYSGSLYRCTTEITTAEEWTASHWTSAKMSEDVSDLKSEFDNKADIDGSYPELSAGNITGDYHLDTEPYLFRPTGGSADVGNREYLDKIVGGTVAWNQLLEPLARSSANGITETFDSQSGAITLSGTATNDWVSLKNIDPIPIGHVAICITNINANPNNLRFKVDMFNGVFASVSGTGSNLTRIGRILQNSRTSYTVGINGFNSGDVTDGTKLYANIIDLTALFNPTIADYIYSLEQATAGAGVAWFRRYFPEDYYPYDAGTLKSVQTSAHKTYDADGNVIGTYPLDSSLTLRGVPKLADGKLAFDGDVYPPSGEVQRRYGVVDLGTLNWTYVGNSAYFYAIISDKAKGFDNIVCSQYASAAQAGVANLQDKQIVGGNNDAAVYIKDTSYTDAASFKAAMSGVMLVYEKTTPTTETADGYEQYQICDPSGTEEFVTTGIVPVGHETAYELNLAQKLINLPWDMSMIAPVEDGATASQAYAQGKYFMRNNEFCKAKTAIASGATFTLNTNYEVTTVAAELFAALS